MDRRYGFRVLGIFYFSGLSLWGIPWVENERTTGENYQDGVALLQRTIGACLEPLDIFFFPEVSSLEYRAHHNYETTDDPDLAFYWKNTRCDGFLEHLVEMRTILQGLTEEVGTLIELAQAIKDEPRDQTPQSQERIQNAYQGVLDTHQMIDTQNAARLRQRCERDRASLFQGAQGS